MISSQEKARVNWRRWKARNPEKAKIKGRRNNAKVRGYDFEKAEVLRESVIACEICGTYDSLHVDHNHTTGKIRGRLCTNCNRGIGYFKDRAFFLERAADYLRAKE